MKAGEATLQGTLTAQQQYLIPIFQRYYTWDTPQWQELWSNIVEIRENPGKRHFMGALVFVGDTVLTFSLPVYLVIDGQQRVLTFSLLLAALRDLCASNGHKELAHEITSSVLVHPFKKGAEHFRVYPRQRDRADFLNAIIGQGKVENRVGKALKYFAEQIRTTVDCSKEEELRKFYNLLLSSLEFVHVNLGGENPYKIFRSLNSTGVDLSPADLIRNFVFMKVPIEQQDDFDNELWTPLENHFINGKKEVNARLVSDFFRDFLMTSGQHITPADTFDSFERRYKSGFDPHQLAADLTASADLYDVIRGSKPHDIAAVDASLTKVRQLDSATAYPLLLHLMRFVKLGLMTDDDFVKCVELITGFIFRRYICGESSRGYSKWFVAACKDVSAPNAYASLEQFLIDKGFPSDSRFANALISFPLYSGRYAFSVLQQLEQSYESKEAPNFDQATIEHIMPQTLSEDWRIDLGPEAQRIYEQWLHTIGNLTLTGYNLDLSNSRFSVKLEGTEKAPGYNGSNFELTKLVAACSKWEEDEIQARGEELAERAVDIWIGPSVQPDDSTVPEYPLSKNTKRAKLFNMLVDGQWHMVPSIQEQFSWDVPHRVQRLKAMGIKSGKWIIELQGDKVRMKWAFKDSPTAPKFDATCDPDDCALKDEAVSGGASDLKQLMLDFWATFAQYMETHSKLPCPPPNGNARAVKFSLGKSGVQIVAILSTWHSLKSTAECEIRVEVALNGDEAKQRFALIAATKQEIEQAIGESLTWRNTEDAIRCRIYASHTADFLKKELWPEQHEWLCLHIEKFRAVFLPIVQNLDTFSDAEVGVK
jgi:hypothetical protein